MACGCLCSLSTGPVSECPVGQFFLRTTACRSTANLVWSPLELDEEFFFGLQWFDLLVYAPCIFWCTHHVSFCVHTMYLLVYTPCIFWCTHHVSFGVHTMYLLVYTPCIFWCTHHVSFGVHTMYLLVYTPCIFWCTHHVSFGVRTMYLLVYAPCIFWCTHHVSFGVRTMYLLVYAPCIFWCTHHVSFGVHTMYLLVYAPCIFWCTHHVGCCNPWCNQAHLWGARSTFHQKDQPVGQGQLAFRSMLQAKKGGRLKATYVLWTPFGRQQDGP